MACNDIFVKSMETLIIHGKDQNGNIEKLIIKNARMHTSFV